MTTMILPNADEDDPELEPLRFRLSKDLKRAAAELTRGQVRYLVDLYYQVQGFRIAAAHETRTSREAGEPADLVEWVGGGMKSLEGAIRAAMEAYTDAHLTSRWAKSITGIGPVLAAGLEAHVDIGKCPTVGHLWRFAGLDPTVTWDPKTKRPWNARLKVLCWKIGESFIKVQAHESDVYGKVYATRKVQEIARNDGGLYAEQAASALTRKKFRKETTAKAAYEGGRLPPAHVHARARRYATKLFLSHWHHVAYEVANGCPPPKPYIISHGGHVDFIAPPNWPMGE